VRTLLNHPLVAPDETCAFIAEARSLGVNCKVIALHGHDPGITGHVRPEYARNRYRYRI